MRQEKTNPGIAYRTPAAKIEPRDGLHKPTWAPSGMGAWRTETGLWRVLGAEARGPAKRVILHQKNSEVWTLWSGEAARAGDNG
jgi:hypothetical protein